MKVLEFLPYKLQFIELKRKRKCKNLPSKWGWERNLGAAIREAIRHIIVKMKACKIINNLLEKKVDKGSGFSDNTYLSSSSLINLI